MSKRWQRKQLYRILPTSMAMDEVDIENQTDNSDEEYFSTNGRMNINETRVNLDNERLKGLKGH